MSMKNHEAVIYVGSVIFSYFLSGFVSNSIISEYILRSFKKRFLIKSACSSSATSSLTLINGLPLSVAEQVIYVLPSSCDISVMLYLALRKRDTILSAALYARSLTVSGRVVFRVSAICLPLSVIT